MERSAKKYKHSSLSFCPRKRWRIHVEEIFQVGCQARKQLNIFRITPHSECYQAERIFSPYGCEALSRIFTFMSPRKFNSSESQTLRLRISQIQFNLSLSSLQVEMYSSGKMILKDSRRVEEMCTSQLRWISTWGVDTLRNQISAVKESSLVNYFHYFEHAWKTGVRMVKFACVMHKMSNKNWFFDIHMISVQNVSDISRSVVCWYEGCCL